MNAKSNQDNRVLCSLIFPNTLVIQAADSPLMERIWLTREQAVYLLEILPEWIAKMSVESNDAKLAEETLKDELEREIRDAEKG